MSKQLIQNEIVTKNNLERFCERLTLKQFRSYLLVGCVE